MEILLASHLVRGHCHLVASAGILSSFAVMDCLWLTKPRGDAPIVLYTQTWPPWLAGDEGVFYTGISEQLWKLRKAELERPLGGYLVQPLVQDRISSAANLVKCFSNLYILQAPPSQKTTKHHAQNIKITL